MGWSTYGRSPAQAGRVRAIPARKIQGYKKPGRNVYPGHSIRGKDSPDRVFINAIPGAMNAPPNAGSKRVDHFRSKGV